MNRLAWAAAALGATAFLVALAFTGGRGGPGLEPFTPKGLMMIPAEDVREVDVAAPHGHWHFVRTQDGWRATQGIGTAGFEARLDSALKLLRNSGPDRVLTEADCRTMRELTGARRSRCCQPSLAKNLGGQEERRDY